MFVRNVWIIIAELQKMTNIRALTKSTQYWRTDEYKQTSNKSLGISDRDKR